MKLIYAGIGLIFLGIIILTLASISSTTVSTTTNGGFAGVVFLGPIPIVFGAGNPSQLPYLFIFGILFTIIALIFFVLPWIIGRKAKYP
ncbi:MULTISPECIES: TIGR00304 family membrane protein [Sulfurisphaera]|uniref:DUF131 domain-containing protein n=3 Tax=Sulfurisphaera TaxID=69655 RepID=Q975S2_SULTO|nr:MULTISPECIES: DUF131 domain-containing protein [Sulfurisphaera]MBB5253082.1 putative membrane protein [Sulfurisphaera ohwakuensis]QGR15995.1 DUF131 domain-containing protein [Sulfurisphaera ohwakuensis]BAB65328.1 hypothetical protein STK_03485 [Sulfurisphaera tokodaii str. 7]HII74974.1 DUF131 domain-containing protein [Sulfurisphaera tokodaii]